MSGKLSIPKIILPWWLKIHSILIFLIWRKGYNCCFPKSRTLGPSATPVRACLCSRHPSVPWVVSFHWMAVPSFWAAHPRSEMPSKGLGALAFKLSSLKHSAFFTHLPLHLTPRQDWELDTWSMDFWSHCEVELLVLASCLEGFWGQTLFRLTLMQGSKATQVWRKKLTGENCFPLFWSVWCSKL